MEKPPLNLLKNGSERSEGSSGSGGEERGRFEYYGWVYHLGVNSIGREYCHLRFLFIRGKYVEMYKRDPHQSPGIVTLSLSPSFYCCFYTIVFMYLYVVAIYIYIGAQEIRIL